MIIKVPATMVDSFRHGWHTTPAGEPGDRTRAGLLAALNALTPEAQRELAAELLAAADAG